MVQVRGGNFTKHITRERSCSLLWPGAARSRAPGGGGAVSIKRRFVSSHRISSSSTHGRSYTGLYTNLGPGVHPPHFTYNIWRHFFTLQFHFVPTRLTKKVKHELRPNLAWTSLASDPREQGHNYPKPVISDLGHTAHSSTAHAVVWEEKLCLALVLVLDVYLSTYTSALEL